jgi:hypothetical protein
VNDHSQYFRMSEVESLLSAPVASDSEAEEIVRRLRLAVLEHGVPDESVVRTMLVVACVKGPTFMLMWCKFRRKVNR